MAVVAVCFGLEVASVLAGQGVHVVLCGADAAGLAGATGALRPGADGRGRLGVLAGDPTDPAVEAAALAMAGELFGGEPVLVRSVDEAAHTAPRSTPPGRSGSSTVDSHSLP